VTPVTCKLCDILFQHNGRQLSQEVETDATGPRPIFSNKLTLLKTAAEEELYAVANMTTNKHVEFQVHLSNAVTDAVSCCIADTDCVANHLEREICGIISNDQMWFKNQFSIRLIEFEAWWKAIGIQ